MEKQTTTQVIINSGPMQFLMAFPAEGRVLRVKIEGSGMVVSMEDDMGHPSDATPFTYALKSLRVVPVANPDNPFGPFHPGGERAAVSR